MPRKKTRPGKGRSKKASGARAAVERVRRELADAAQIQARLLPAKMPQIPGYDFYAWYRSATELGGDYYDFFPLDGERLGVVVADASPTGIPGAIIMAITRTLVRTLAPACESGAETLRRVNARLGNEIRRGMFVTALFAELNLRSREMTVCNAGHPPAIVYRAGTGEIELAGSGTIPLGVESEDFFDKALSEERVPLEPGDRVVLHTNGVVKVRNADDEEFGVERLHAFVRKHARKRSLDFVGRLVGALDDHRADLEQPDDIVVCTLRTS